MATHPNASSHTAEQMLEFLTGKIRSMPFVNVVSTLNEKNGNRWYSIKVTNNNLSRIGNGIFHAVTLNTITTDTRMVNIRILFNDSNKELNADMKANADALIAIFREIAQPQDDSHFTRSTIDTIEIKEFEDARKNKHLAVFATSIRGASLVHTYKVCVDFVREVNSRYGADATAPSRQGRGKPVDDIEKQKQVLRQKLAELELQQAHQLTQDPAPARPAAAADEAAPAIPAATPMPKKKVPNKYNVKMQIGNNRTITLRTPSPQVGMAVADTTDTAPAAADTIKE